MSSNSRVQALLLFFYSSSCAAWTWFEPQVTQVAKTKTIMLDPAGDAKYSGRIIDDTFERGITLQCAQELKKALESKDPSLRVILTRMPGEEIEYLQNASFANRLHVDFYLSIHFCRSKSSFNTVTLYHLLYHPTTDYWKTTTQDLAFIPYNKAHQPYATQSKAAGALLLQKLEATKHEHYFVAQGLWGIPIKPLVALTCPALLCECAVTEKNSWKKIVDSLADGIIALTHTG